MTNAQILEEMRKMNVKMDEMKTSIEKKLNSKVDSLGKTIKENQEKLMSEIQRCRTEMKADLDLEVGRLSARLEALEGKTGQGAEGAPPQRFDPAVSLVVYGLQQERDEIILEVVKCLLSEGLGSDILPKDAERLKARGDGPAVVKVECNSTAEKVAILRLKPKLKDQPRFDKVYVKSAKSHTERLIELNFRTMMKEIPQGKDFFMTGSGRLVKRQETPKDGDQPLSNRASGNRKWNERRWERGRVEERERAERERSGQQQGTGNDED